MVSQVYTGNCKQFPEGEKRHGIGTYVARPALKAFESRCSMLLNVSPKYFTVQGRLTCRLTCTQSIKIHNITFAVALPSILAGASED